MSAIKIRSERVILVEGNADEFVSGGRFSAGMHGFMIVVPSGEGGERFLDLLWRIAMIYAGMPSLLRSRATVRKMVEAVMGKVSRESNPARSRARKAIELPCGALVNRGHAFVSDSLSGHCLLHELSG